MKGLAYKSQYNFCNRTFKLDAGTGFTPEGLTDSYITTELMSEMYRTNAKYDSLDFTIFITKIWKIQ